VSIKNKNNAGNNFLTREHKRKRVNSVTSMWHTGEPVVKTGREPCKMSREVSERKEWDTAELTLRWKLGKKIIV
jgi:hypothetical protein